MSEALRAGVLFDVDGTLVDTNYLHALAWSRAFRDAREWAPMNAIHRLVGMGGDQLVPRLLGHENSKAVAARPGRYKEFAEDMRSFPKSAELLEKVHGLGLVVVLATSAPEVELQQLPRCCGQRSSSTGRQLPTTSNSPSLIPRSLYPLWSGSR